MCFGRIGLTLYCILELHNRFRALTLCEKNSAFNDEGLGVILVPLKNTVSDLQGLLIVLPDKMNFRQPSTCQQAYGIIICSKRLEDSHTLIVVSRTQIKVGEVEA